KQTAAVVPPPPPMKPEPPKPQSKPAAQQPPRRTEEPAHSTRRASYPGPAASRDDYLAYVHSLIRQNYNMLPLAMVGGRRGAAGAGGRGSSFWCSGTARSRG